MNSSDRACLRIAAIDPDSVGRGERALSQFTTEICPAGFILRWQSGGNFSVLYFRELAPTHINCGDIDTVVYGAATGSPAHVADMDADAKQICRAGLAVVLLGHALLYFQGSAHRVDNGTRRWRRRPRASSLRHPSQAHADENAIKLFLPNFMIAQVKLANAKRIPRPVAPYDRDIMKAARHAFDRILGQPVPSSDLMSLQDALGQFFVHPESKFQNGGVFQRGVLERRHVTIDIQKIHYIGKESYEFEEQFHLGF